MTANATPEDGRLPVPSDECFVFAVEHPDHGVSSVAWTLDSDADDVHDAFRHEHPDPFGVERSHLLRVRRGAPRGGTTTSGPMLAADLHRSMRHYRNPDSVDRDDAACDISAVRPLAPFSRRLAPLMVMVRRAQPTQPAVLPRVTGSARWRAGRPAVEVAVTWRGSSRSVGLRWAPART